MIGSVTVSRKRLNVFHVVDTRVNLASIHRRDTNFVARYISLTIVAFRLAPLLLPSARYLSKHCNARVLETTLDGVFAGRERLQYSAQFLPHTQIYLL